MDISKKEEQRYLQRLCAKNEIWILPSNEITLLQAYNTLRELNLILCSHIHIPGTAYHFKKISALELSDKGLLFDLLSHYEFKSFELTKTQSYSFKDINNLNLSDGPHVLKLADKNLAEDFFRKYPEKIHFISSVEELYDLYEREKHFLGQRRFILQKYIQGEAVSWAGYCEGQIHEGVLIKSLIKSPVSHIGGTTTYAKKLPTTKRVDCIVSELVKELKLDGIFEIEFIQRGDSFFLVEINPRPFLQIQLLIDHTPNLVTEYFRNKGFEIKKHSPSTSKVFWGSTMRYLKKDKIDFINKTDLFHIFTHDVRFSSYFSIISKLKYIGQLIKLLIKKLILKI